MASALISLAMAQLEADAQAQPNAAATQIENARRLDGNSEQMKKSMEPSDPSAEGAA